MKKPAAPRKGAKMHAPHKTGGGPKRKGVRASGAPVPAPVKHHHPAPHHPHHPPGHRMTNPLVPAPHHHRHVKPVKRKLSFGDVACCSAEALAASLRLAGVPVGDEDVLALYWRTAESPEAGALISATLEAAERFGLAGVRPVSLRTVPVRGVGIGAPEFPDREVPGAVLAGNPSLPLPAGGVELPARAIGGVPDGVGSGHVTSVILGVTLPGGPHALLADGDTWWSWGEPWPSSAFSGAVIEEAWAVQWVA